MADEEWEDVWGGGGDGEEEEDEGEEGCADDEELWGATAAPGRCRCC
jgi:hypothetical protein